MLEMTLWMGTPFGRNADCRSVERLPLDTIAPLTRSFGKLNHMKSGPPQKVANLWPNN